MLVLALVLAAAPLAVGDGSKGGQVIVLVHDDASLDAVIGTRDVEVVARFRVLHGFVANVSAAGWKRLSSDPRVSSIEISRTLRMRNEEAATLTGVREVEETYGYTGRGVRIAMLDTGVDRRHPDLDGGLIGEKCFVAPDGCTPDSTAVGELAPDSSTGHGTHIAGTITGDGVVAPRGIASASELVVIRVFDSSGVGSEADWTRALDWVLAERGRFGFQLVNLSLGTDFSYGGTCDSEFPAMATALSKLRAAGVASFSASGNENVDGGINAPACLTSTIAVGGVYDANLDREPDNGTYASGCADDTATAGSVICFSNSSTKVSLLAPGSQIRSSFPGGQVATKRGTSQAAAHATAVAALLLEADPTLTPQTLESMLVMSGVPTLDPKTGLTTPRIDALAAVTLTLQTQCSRRAAGASCTLTPTTQGMCTDGTCVVRTFPVLTSEFPAAGCATTPTLAGAGLLTLALAAWRRHRRASKHADRD
ncbi:MAG: S8 family serine peptidase [Archangium sp.]